MNIDQCIIHSENKFVIGSYEDIIQDIRTIFIYVYITICSY